MNRSSPDSAARKDALPAALHAEFPQVRRLLVWRFRADDCERFGISWCQGAGDREPEDPCSRHASPSARVVDRRRSPRRRRSEKITPGTEAGRASQGGRRTDGSSPGRLHTDRTEQRYRGGHIEPSARWLDAQSHYRRSVTGAPVRADVIAASATATAALPCCGSKSHWALGDA